MAPLCNRLAGNQFRFGGRAYSLPSNTEDPLYLHGDGWLADWQIEDQSPSAATLSFGHDGAFRYGARQEVRLEGKTLVAKHALLGLTKSLTLEYANRSVRVNALAPGYVETQKTRDWWNSAPDPDKARAETLALHPSGRIAQPSEIAKAALFMISDEPPFMNGSCLVVDGGLSILQHA